MTSRSMVDGDGELLRGMVGPYIPGTV
jgi:hypothetical protein